MNNDYELIYLIRGENDHIALQYLFDKYERFIWKIIHLLNVTSYDHDDFIQEGTLIFYKAIQSFNEEKNKSFTRYFELILKRHFYQLLNKSPKYVYDEYVIQQQTSYYIEENYDDFLSTCSKIEKDVFDCYFIEQKSIQTIANQLKCSKKQIYNTIFRLKEKYKKYVII